MSLGNKRLDFDVMQTLDHGPDLLIIGFGTHRGRETPGILRLALHDHRRISATGELYFLHLGWREASTILSRKACSDASRTSLATPLTR